MSSTNEEENMFPLNIKKRKKKNENTTIYFQIEIPSGNVFLIIKSTIMSCKKPRV